MPAIQTGVPQMLSEIESGAIAWVDTCLPSNAGQIRVTDACRDELLTTTAQLEANPLPIFSLRLADFDMPGCRAMMALAKETLERGVGFVVIDRLPIEDISRDTATALYWLLTNMVGRTVAQKWDGTMVYDVRDTGKALVDANGVRSSVTNAGQEYHNDNAFNLPPDYVALFCLQTAKEGGVNGVVSFQTAHNKMLARHPDLLERLYEPFYFDRQMEHAPNDDRVSVHPIFEYDGKILRTRFSDRLTRVGYEMRGDSIDQKGSDAIETLTEIINEPGARREFMFEPGQIQIVDNRRLGHRRTAFTDWPEPERRRHLVRLWARDAGRPFYLG